MSNVKNVKRWFLIHKWTSLVCTVFLLMLCLTGLPLIFHEEIAEWEGKMPAAPEMPAGTPKISLDKIVEQGQQQRPNEVIRYVFWNEETPNQVILSMADSLQSAPEVSNLVVLDERTAQLLHEPELQEGFMYVMLKLHVDMFAGILGKLFLGLMGMCFLVAIVSGVMLYGPIMRRFNFGMIRRDKSTRLKWLDMHNLLGIVVLSWTLVVGFTGVINTLSDVVVFLWQSGQLKEMAAPYENKPAITGKLSSLQEAVQVATAVAPDMKPSVVAFPGTMFSSKHHYAVFMRGATPLTSKLIKPVLVDAQTGKLTDTRSMPWYVNALFISQPLHFGDYGGIPLKIIWALFDVATIVILISGLYLWLARRKATAARIDRIQSEALLQASIKETEI
ncbi:PepSY-associated TM helix domain-containing protein [Chitinophaga nivalis]|uniref:PepSY domain-containing protein n=1 Tax=Chitinophaga nivalis TaxID=2991709 RepID=A0ABT3IKY3_9BACT|nr:PepSY domain-containing protein [Chitinophaga nivalis]MCW3465685.1 PepSY domain-containing protein [Chitinophaga nivalis]MCW3484624.1 PepSY domain-containing protein [Chitinophaga nivalis]